MCVCSLTKSLVSAPSNFAVARGILLGEGAGVQSLRELFRLNGTYSFIITLSSIYNEKRNGLTTTLLISTLWVFEW